MSNIVAEICDRARQISDAVLMSVLNWDDALGLAYRLSSFYENHTEKSLLADAIWQRAQEAHQLDWDERNGRSKEDKHALDEVHG